MNVNGSDSYLEEMLLIVADSFALSSQNATLPEKMARATAWARVLREVVPEDRLQDAFDAAFRNHDSSFAVNAYEIKSAWVDLATAEQAERERIEAEERSVNRVAYCPNRKNHSTEDGTMLVCNPFNFNEEIELPCGYCRPQAFEEQRQLFIQKHGAIKPLEILDNVVAMRKEK